MVGGEVDGRGGGRRRTAWIIAGWQADELGGECVAAGGAGGVVVFVRVGIAVMGGVVVRHRNLVMRWHRDAAQGFQHDPRR